MKIWRYFVFLIFVPFLSWGSTHIINQAFFLNSKSENSWDKKDRIIVLGGDRVDIQIIAKARKKFPKSEPIYWLLSDDQWSYKNLSLNRDQKAIDFASQLEELFIQVLPKNLCPKPAVFHEKNYEIVIIDSSWFLFPHQAELFIRQCQNPDRDRFYNEVEEAILNAKFKPLVIIARHGVDSKLVYGEKNVSLEGLTQQIQQSMGPINGISNPAYQEYKDKLTEWMGRRPNIMFVSSGLPTFFRDSNQGLHHIALPEDKPDELTLEENKAGVKVMSEEFPEPIQLGSNESTETSSVCNEYTGPMYDFKHSSKIYKYFLGTNYRDLWDQPVTANCFDLEKENLVVVKIGGSLRSPDFLLRDKQGNFYALRPLKREIRIPDVLKGTIVEDVLLDQQSAFNPLGYILAAALSRMVGMPTENPKLVYIDVNQKAFASWKDREFKSGFYQFLQQPLNLLRNLEWRKKGVREIISDEEMVHRVENEHGYKLDQEAYLKARLFDILIGDWDREVDQWYWMVIPTEKYKMLVPYPINRDAAFYHGDGVISWWRRRKWINYKLQDYGKRLKRPEPMMIQSFSMDHRYTSNLTLAQWNKVVDELQKQLTLASMEQALSELPVAISPEEKQWLIQSFQKRLKELPQIAGKMRLSLRESVDVVGTSDPDRFVIQSGPGHFVDVTEATNGEITYSDRFDSDFTKEIRIYGLNGDDGFKLNWWNYTATKIRLIPGIGKDKIVARDDRVKPNVSIYDDDFSIDSYYGFTNNNYQPIYNDYYSQINQRKLNVLAPVLFLATRDADSGFTIGGGIKFYDEGFQHAPWASTNEIKSNVVLNRSAVNITYIGTWYDVLKQSDFETDIDAGLPRFYGSFFGLGNSPPDLNPAKPESYYWIRARHLESTVKLSVPVFQHVSVTPRLQFRFNDFLIDQNSVLSHPAENHLDTQLKPGTNANIGNAKYYLGSGLSLNYISDDSVSGPVKKRVIRAEAKWMYQQGLAPEEGHFQTLDLNGGLTGYFSKSKTQWKASGGYGHNYGDWEFFDAQFLGQGQNLRGFFMNRFAGSARVYDSFEVNQSLAWRNFSLVTDFGLGGFFDNGRVFLSGDTGSNIWHKSLGGQAWITILNSFAFKTGYSHAIFEDAKGLWSFTLTTEL